MSDNPNLIKVKRSGPRGWHWIDRASYDPAKHELYDALKAAPAPEGDEKGGKGKGKGKAAPAPEGGVTKELTPEEADALIKAENAKTAGA